MGTFATFKFKEPLRCPFCSETHFSIQYKMDGMDHYSVGDSCDIFDKNSIVEQEYYCFERREPSCDEISLSVFGYNVSKFFYIVIKDWHYIGVVPNLSNAKALGIFSDKNYTYYN